MTDDPYRLPCGAPRLKAPPLELLTHGQHVACPACGRRAEWALANGPTGQFAWLVCVVCRMGTKAEKVGGQALPELPDELDAGRAAARERIAIADSIVPEVAVRPTGGLPSRT